MRYIIQDCVGQLQGVLDQGIAIWTYTALHPASYPATYKHNKVTLIVSQAIPHQERHPASNSFIWQFW